MLNKIYWLDEHGKRHFCFTWRGLPEDGMARGRKEAYEHGHDVYAMDYEKVQEAA